MYERYMHIWNLQKDGAGPQAFTLRTERINCYPFASIDIQLKQAYLAKIRSKISWVVANQALKFLQSLLKIPLQSMQVFTY
jgi:hypothetical protein